MDGKMLRVSEVAAAWDVNPNTVYRAIERGRLDAVRVGRVLRIPIESVRAFERRNRIRAVA